MMFHSYVTLFSKQTFYLGATFHEWCFMASNKPKVFSLWNCHYHIRKIIVSQLSEWCFLCFCCCVIIFLPLIVNPLLPFHFFYGIVSSVLFIYQYSRRKCVMGSLDFTWKSSFIQSHDCEGEVREWPFIFTVCSSKVKLVKLWCQNQNYSHLL